MDEAGIQGDAPFCTIAGYIAQVAEWDLFERDWRFILDQYMVNVPLEHRYFHALEFYGSDWKYRHWSSSKRASFETALFESIRDRGMALFMSCVDSRVFHSLTEDERRYLTGGQHNGMKWKKHGAPTKPYFLPFQFCMIQSASFVRNGDKVFPVMSRQEQYKMKALELYGLMLNSDPPMQCRNKLADDMVFSDPKKTPALQASDLAVFWWSRCNNWRARTGESSDKFPDLIYLERLTDNVRESGDLKMFDFQGMMLGLQGCNRYIKTSFPSLDQLLPSLPVEERTRILAVMRKADLRKFLDQRTPTAQADRGQSGNALAGCSEPSLLRWIKRLSPPKSLSEDRTYTADR